MVIYIDGEKVDGGARKFFRGYVRVFEVDVCVVSDVGNE